MLSLVGEPSTGPHASPSVNNDKGRTEAVRERSKSSCSFSRPGATMAAAQVLDTRQPLLGDHPFPRDVPQE